MRSIIGGIGRRQPDQAAAGIGDFEGALAVALEHAAERLRQLAQLGVAPIWNRRPRAAAPRRCCRARPARSIQVMRASRSTRRTSSRSAVEALLAHVVGVDLEQDVRAALQIEAEHQPALRPGRPGLDDLLGEEIRAPRTAQTTNAVSRMAIAFQREKYSMMSRPRCCRRRISSTAASSFTGSPLARTSATMLLHLPDAHAVGDFDLDLVVVDHLGDLADQAAVGDRRCRRAARS